MSKAHNEKIVKRAMLLTGVAVVTVDKALAAMSTKTKKTWCKAIEAPGVYSRVVFSKDISRFRLVITG